ncbi:MAG: glucose 1-dehydrogenase [Rhodospirillaceae bacterium]|nr:glucose 1-dehydrogenase [Rhodospirillaceae bacterium]
MSTALFDLTGRTALVTGSSRGIGHDIAKALAAAGARVLVNGRNEAAVAATVETLRAAGARVRGYAFDVTDEAAINAALTAIDAEIGPIDILVNNAGIQRRMPMTDVPLETWAEVLDTNLTAVFLMARTVARRMIERKSGKIINICSLMSELGRPTIGPYTASKGGVKMLTKAMCAEWARHNIQVNGIGPGYFATDMNTALVEDEAFNAWVCNRTPAGRWGRTEELGGAAVFLASAASDFVNGHILYVDGGMLAVV